MQPTCQEARSALVSNLNALYSNFLIYLYIESGSSPELTRMFLPQTCLIIRLGQSDQGFDTGLVQTIGT